MSCYYRVAGEQTSRHSYVSWDELRKLQQDPKVLYITFQFSNRVTELERQNSGEWKLLECRAKVEPRGSRRA